LALDLTATDAVIVPAITFAATANAVLYSGANVVFADIDEKTGNICPQSVARAHQIALDNGWRPRAVMPVHYSGKPVAMAQIIEFSRRHGLQVIEDCCHALGAQYRLGGDEAAFSMVGSARESEMCVFSFHPVKHIATGEGGAIATNDDVLAASLRTLRTHGITKTPSNYVNLARAKDAATGRWNPWYTEMQALGFNYRLSDILAVLGVSQLSRLDVFLARRREIAATYRRELAGLPAISFIADDDAKSLNSYHLFPVLVDFAKLGKSRAQVMEELHANGVGTQVHYIPIPWHPYYERHPAHWRSDAIPQAERFYNKTLSIPMYPAMTADDLGRVLRNLKRVLG